MNESARAEALNVPRETRETLQAFVTILLEANEQQNLIARSTIPEIWSRHIEDSLQLLPLAPANWQSWLDIGAGGGLPGIVIAIASSGRVTLAETRRKRRDFLVDSCSRLGLSERVRVVGKVAEVGAPQHVISARAVASLDALFEIGQPAADQETVWLLPKGRSAAEELASARRTWQGRFKLVSSLTDPAAGIVTARGARRKGQA